MVLVLELVLVLVLLLVLLAVAVAVAVVVVVVAVLVLVALVVIFPTRPADQLTMLGNSNLQGEFSFYWNNTIFSCFGRISCDFPARVSSGYGTVRFLSGKALLSSHFGRISCYLPMFTSGCLGFRDLFVEI